ncbi:hypothetical protein [Acinetobacter sp. KS-LM10]|uniref:hypothetical protein n=1 Tax=Acinetobacter sp. KS-LM10 TaxID=3120518 RepID=UPI0030D24C22
MVGYILKNILFVLVFILTTTGCSKIQESYQIGSALYLVGVMNNWDKFSVEKKNAGIIRTLASPSELSYLRSRLDNEYVAALEVIGKMAGDSPSAIFKKSIQKDLDNSNSKFIFPINEAYSLRDKTTKEIFGYCVDHNIQTVTNGIPEKDLKKRHTFSYVDMNKKISFFAMSDDLIKNLCGESFYQSVNIDNKVKK